MTLQKKFDHLMHLIDSKSLNVEDFIYPEFIKAVNFDYSSESLEQLDNFLSSLSNRNTTFIFDLNDKKTDNFLLLISFYIVKFISKQTDHSFELFYYDEGIEKLASQKNNYKKDFNSTIIVFFGNLALMPFFVLDSYLLSRTNDNTVQEFVKNGISFIQDQIPTKGDEWNSEYLDWFISNKKVPGGIKFEDSIRKINFDYTVASLYRLDSFLLELKAHKLEYEKFVTRLSFSNTLWLLATYLAKTTAMLECISLKWLNYNQVLTLNKSIKLNFESTYCCAMGDGLVFPILAINEILFSKENKSSCITFLGNISNLNIPKMELLNPDLNITRENNIKKGIFKKFLPLFSSNLWEDAIEKVGFLAAHGAFMLSAGLSTPPILLQSGKNKNHIMLDFSMYSGWDEANQRGQSMLKNNPDECDYQLYLYDAFIYPPQGRKDAMVIDLVCYKEKSLYLTIAIPYLFSNDEFKLYLPNLVKCSNENLSITDITNYFFAGVQKNNAFDWHKHFEKKSG